MSVITKIEEQKNKRRVNIYVDDAFFCGLLKETALSNSLKVGKFVEPEKLSEILLESEIRSAFEKATDYLSSRMHSAKELSDKLLKKGYPKPAIDGAISRLVDYKYIDDAKFAKDFVLQNSKYSKKMLENKLLSKGVDKKYIQEALGLVQEDEELKLCTKQVEKYLKSHKITNLSEKQKFYASMLRRGYSYELVSRAIKPYFDKNFDEDIDFYEN